MLYTTTLQAGVVTPSHCGMNGKTHDEVHPHTSFDDSLTTSLLVYYIHYTRHTQCPARQQGLASNVFRLFL
jgi:hypothetical protein